MNPDHTLTPTTFNSHFNISLLSTPRSSMLSLPFQVFRLKFCAHFTSFCAACYLLVCLHVGDQQKRNSPDKCQSDWQDRLTKCIPSKKQYLLSTGLVFACRGTGNQHKGCDCGHMKRNHVWNPSVTAMIRFKSWTFGMWRHVMI
jgi:hypothetical protein